MTCAKLMQWHRVYERSTVETAKLSPILLTTLSYTGPAKARPCCGGQRAPWRKTWPPSLALNKLGKSARRSPENGTSRSFGGPVSLGFIIYTEWSTECIWCKSAWAPAWAGLLKGPQKSSQECHLCRKLVLFCQDLLSTEASKNVDVDFKDHLTAPAPRDGQRKGWWWQ